MTALARLIGRGGDGPTSPRTSFRIREELAALVHPERHDAMIQEIDQRRAQLPTLDGQARKDGEREVAELVENAASYRAKNDRTFVQAATLLAELVEVVGRERQAIIASRQEFHSGGEAEECARLARLAREAATESMAQRIATNLLAKGWGIESLAPWQFGFPPKEIEARAREILEELQNA